MTLGATTLAVLLAGCGSSSAFSARMTSWSPIDNGRIVVEYQVENDSPVPARVGCILTATDRAGNGVSNFVVSRMVGPGRSARSVGYLRTLDHPAFRVQDVTVGDCTRALHGSPSAPPAED